MRRYLFFGCLAMFISMSALAIDILLEYMGIKARTVDSMWLFIYTGISVVTHMAIQCSPLFRHMTGGKRWMWTVLAVPALLCFSLITTTVSQSSYIKGQAKQIEANQAIKEARLDVAQGFAKSAQIQQRYDYATRSNSSLANAADLLDKAESQAGSGNVTNDEAVTIPLAIINSALPSPMSVEQFLIAYYTLMSFGLVLIGYFFSELSLTLFGKAGQTPDMSETTPDIKTNKQLAANEVLTDKHSQAAIDLRLSQGKSGGKSWSDADINRSWVYKAHIDMFGKARKGETLDRFIDPTKRKLKPWHAALTG